MSRHYQTERRAREERIRKIGLGKVVASFIIDRGHPNGPEIHKLTSTAIILIYNQRTRVHVTSLIARPGQIKRYYKNSDILPDKEIIRLARIHQKMGLNK